jgi:hypothetical protein
MDIENRGEVKKAESDNTGGLGPTGIVYISLLIRGYHEKQGKDIRGRRNN